MLRTTSIVYQFPTVICCGKMFIKLQTSTHNASEKINMEWELTFQDFRTNQSLKSLSVSLL